MDNNGSSSRGNTGQGATDSKGKSKSTSQDKAKIQQEADLAGFGSQFTEDDQLKSTNPASYPKKVYF